MKRERLVVGVPRRSGLQSSHVRSMAQLGLRIAANVLILLCLFEKFFMLLRCSLIPYGFLFET